MRERIIKYTLVKPTLALRIGVEIRQQRFVAGILHKALSPCTLFQWARVFPITDTEHEITSKARHKRNQHPCLGYFGAAPLRAFQKSY